MNKIIVVIVISLILSSCDGMSQNKDFKKFEEKFVLRELPIFIPGECGERSSNDQSNLTLSEFDKILALQNSKWKYKEEYYYNSGCKFNIDQNIIGIIYFRSYLPMDIAKEVGECVLVIFSSEGKIIDQVLIQGNVGDNLSYTGKITSELTIEVKFEELFLDENGNSIIENRIMDYQITSDGKIIEK